jgi:hypothetical protein
VPRKAAETPASGCLRAKPGYVKSLRILLAPHAFDFAALLFKLLLLRLNLALRLVVLNLLILHRVADRIAADATKAATDQRTRCRMANGRTDYRSSTGAEQGATARAHLTITKRLSRASAKEEHNRECNSGGRNPTFAHKNFLLYSLTHVFHNFEQARSQPSL